MARLVIAAALLLVALTGSAAADERGRAAYPYWLSDQPLVLPRWTAQLTVDLGITNIKLQPNSSATTGLATGVGFDLGLPRRLQVGAFFGMPLYVGADFGVFDVSLTAELLRQLALRVDLGVMRASDYEHTRMGSRSIAYGNAFQIGVGLPFRLKLHRVVSLVGGRTATRSFGVQPVFANIGYNRVYGIQNFGDDLLAFQFFGEYGGAQVLYGALFLPLGLEVQPIAQLAFGVRTGYRVHFQRYFQPTTQFSTTHYVPLSLEVLVRPLRILDIAFDATSLGEISTDRRRDVRLRQWVAVRQFDIWIAVRF